MADLCTCSNQLQPHDPMDACDRELAHELVRALEIQERVLDQEEGEE